MEKKKAKEVGIESLPFDGNIIPVNEGNYQDEFLYGKSIEKIKSKQISGLTGGGNFFAGNVSYNTTGVKTVSGVGFTPKLVKIYASNTQSFSSGYGFNGTEFCQYTQLAGGVATIGYSSVLYNGGSNTVTESIEMTSDGFTIDVTNVAGGAGTYIYECYG